MSENETVEKTIGYLQIDQGRLTEICRAKEKELEKVNLSLSRLSSKHYWQQPLKTLFTLRAKKLRTEITTLRQKLDQCIKAETELRKGEYGLAITLLGQIGDRFIYPTSFFSANIWGISQQVTIDPRFYHITKLMSQLSNLQKEKAMMDRTIPA